MTPKPGTYELTQDDGTLLLHTSCTGAMAKMGHDLTLRADAWTATVRVGEQPSDSSLEVKVDMHSLKLVGARGGAKQVSDSDSSTIEENARKELQPGKFPELHYVSSSASGTNKKVELKGDLTIAGSTQPQQLTVTTSGDELVCSGVVTQTRFGLKPFSTMMGALKLADDVELEARVRLP